MSKLKTTPLTAPREWAALKEAFDRIMTHAGERNFAGRQLNRHLRSGQLRSARVQSSPDGKDTEELLKPSDWEQWTVLVPSLRVDGWDPNVVAHLFVLRVDLDKLYPLLPLQRESSRPAPAGPTSPSLLTNGRCRAGRRRRERHLRSQSFAKRTESPRPNIMK